MTLNNGIIFYGLNRDSDDFLHMLDQRITDRIESVKEFAESPIEYVEKYKGWFIDKSYLGFGQEGGYESKEQAIIALSLIKVKDSLKYQQLWSMSKFILAGIETL
jgi:hypothetical protein